ncbi:unnamed protein product [Arctia plantaginis]|uniref:Uncharacterized protein n=1 Tax=Arctia plantaginis TaxID=874455 RepID=A0A8S1BA75_ARCPL|nr:unnamed protein product [Arctia plantaginis]
MECCFTDFKKCDDGFCVSPAFAAVAPDCCEPAECYEEKPVLYCCEKKPPKVVYCCQNKEVVYNCNKKPPGAAHHSEKKPTKVVYCCEKEPPKVVYCCEKPATPPSPPPKHCCEESCRPVKTKYIMPCYRYEDGRIVEKLPVTAFKRNGMQDQEHSKLLGTVNFLVRSPRDVSIECPDNQPTVLMRRACEVACGRRKPFVASSYHVDADHEERRYHSEDGKGNLCFHYERKQPEYNCCVPNVCCDPVCVPTSRCHTMCRHHRHFVSCLPANPCSAPNCCYYYGV